MHLWATQIKLGVWSPSLYFLFPLLYRMEREDKDFLEPLPFSFASHCFVTTNT